MIFQRQILDLAPFVDRISKDHSRLRDYCLSLPKYIEETVTNTTDMVNIYRRDGYKYYKDGKYI